MDPHHSPSAAVFYILFTEVRKQDLAGTITAQSMAETGQCQVSPGPVAELLSLHH